MKLKSSPEDFKVIEQMNLSFQPSGDFSYYQLEKKDISLPHVVNIISKKWKIQHKFINYSGIKDKIAMTSQFISIKRGPRKNLEEESFSLIYKGCGDERINLGSHNGNAFEIVIRDITATPTPPKLFLNTFGEQRFGMNKNNHLIGKLLVQKDMQKAAEELAHQHHDVKEALEKNPTNFIGAIRSLPKKILLLYLHAYQSFLWNEVAEKLAKTTKENISIPLVGFGTEFEDKLVENSYKTILKREGITKHDFIIRSIPELAVEGTERELYVEPKDLSIGELVDDEENKGKKIKIMFSLPNGSYATEIIKQLF